MGTLQGSWIWYELMTSDTQGAKAFYEPLVGWNMTASHGTDMDYGFIANADGGMTGGLMGITQDMAANGARPAWLGYVGVDDCAASVEAIKAAGGTLYMGPHEVPGVGTFAMVADRSGAPFYVMTPKPPEGSDGQSTSFSPTLPGRCGWNELLADDQAEALAFYTGLFGWSLPEPMDMGPMGTYQFIAHDEVTLGAIMQKPAAMPAPPHWNFYFRVPSIAAAAEQARAGGGQVVNGPMEVPGGDWIIQGIDPQGAFFCLVGGQ